MPAPTAIERLRHLLTELAGTDGIVELSTPRLARELGVTPSCARDAVRRLEQAGDLRLERFMTHTGTVLPNRYHLRPDPGRGLD
jgi:hypothetical protein